MIKYYYFLIGLIFGNFLQNNIMYNIIEYIIIYIIFIILFMLIIYILNIECVNNYIEDLMDKFIYSHFKIDFE